MRLIDLSLELSPSVSEPEPLVVDTISHSQGAYILGKRDGLTPNDFPDQMALSLERIQITSHSGTHMDAPLHYGPTCEGKPSKGISDIPLSWCFSDGVMVDCRKPGESQPVNREEIERYLEKINYKIKPLDIVLICTGADALWGTPHYFTQFRGVSLDATKWLVDQGVKVIGVDSFGFDPPFERMLDHYKATKDQMSLWPCHVLGRTKEYCQIERLANLSALLELTKFKVCCFPIKITQCGAGWCRVVAIG